MTIFINNGPIGYGGSTSSTIPNKEEAAAAALLLYIILTLSKMFNKDVKKI